MGWLSASRAGVRNDHRKALRSRGPKPCLVRLPETVNPHGTLGSGGLARDPAVWL